MQFESGTVKANLNQYPSLSKMKDLTVAYLHADAKRLTYYSGPHRQDTILLK